MTAGRAAGRPLELSSAFVWLFAALVIIWPVIALVVGTLWDNSIGAPPNWGLDAFARAIGSPRFLPAVGTTVLFCALVVPAAVFIALVMALIGQFSNARLRRAIGPTMLVSYAIPALFYSVGYALVGSGRAGAGNDLLAYLFGVTPFNLTSFPGLIFVSILRASAYVYILLIGPVSTLGRSQDEAARISGARLPLRFGMIVSALRPTIIGATILTTIGNIQVFDAVYILGGNLGIDTLSTLTYRLIQQQHADFPAASAIGSLLLVLVAGLILLQNAATRRGRFTTLAVKPQAPLRLPLGGWRIPVDLLIVAHFTVALLVPIASLFVTSAIPFPGVYTSFGLGNYARIWSNPDMLHAAWTSFVLANGGAVAAVVIALVMIGHRRRQTTETARALVDIVMLAPKVMYGIVTAVAFIWAVTIFPATRSLYGTGILLFVALTVSALPITYMLLSGASAQVDDKLEQAARVSGAGGVSAQVLVRLPLLAPSIVNAWFLSMVLIAGALDIPLVLGTVDLRVIATTVFELYSLNGDFGAAAALLMTMLAAFALLALLTRGIVLLVRADLRTWRPPGAIAAAEGAA